ncbi:MAG: Rho termination factor N-terminal domain-containing protein, partial [Phycisphaerae bacterium]|nr:Rho termination factor N-terminal domain-containing protein [Phycisphaerae bacterium]
MAKTVKKTKKVAKKTASNPKAKDELQKDDSLQEPTISPTDAAEAPQTAEKDSAGAEEKKAPVSDSVAEFDEEMHAKYERVKRGELHITDLQKLSVAELHEIAKTEGIAEYTGLGKQELVFRILKGRIQKDGLMYGEGVLEILPDGFGFLRSPDYNYL